jgi:hypothetical protein
VLYLGKQGGTQILGFGNDRIQKENEKDKDVAEGRKNIESCLI